MALTFGSSEPSFVRSGDAQALHRSPNRYATLQSGGWSWQERGIQLNATDTNSTGIETMLDFVPVHNAAMTEKEVPTLYQWAGGID